MAAVADVRMGQLAHPEALTPELVEATAAWMAVVTAVAQHLQDATALLQGQPRLLAVLRKAANEADWGRPLGEGRGRGISLQDSFGTIVAQVVEVTVEKGEIQVDRVVAAVNKVLYR